MIYGIPGINGLGKTKGVEQAPLNFLAQNKILKINRENISEQKKEIYDFASHIFERESKSIFIGGDHSISYPLSKAFFKKNKDAKILIFDAHPDLMPAEFEPTHEEWLRTLIENMKIKGEKILIVGVRRNSRNIDLEEINYAKKNKIGIIYSDEFQDKKGKILEFIKEANLYLSFDVDVFDESSFFATGYPEARGLKKREIYTILKKIKINKQKFAFDLVEYNPQLDINKKNSKIVGKVLKIIKTT